MCNSVARLAWRFADAKDGNFAIITAIVLSAVSMAVGLGVNVAQLYSVKSNLQHALDVAVTSTARDLTIGRIPETEAHSAVETMLFANADPQFVRADSLELNSIELNTTERTLRAKATVDVDVLFPLFGLANFQQISTQSAAVYSDKTIEVAMMLDVTGSMQKDFEAKKYGPSDKIGDLKIAAEAAVNTFLDMNFNPAAPRVRVAIIPYAQSVNTGLLSEAVYNEQKGLPDSPPDLTGWLAALLTGAKKAPDNCTTERKASDGFSMDLSDSAPSVATVNRDNRLGSACPSAPLEPLTANRESLIDTIKQFTADGGTAGQVGIQWTRYLLSPNWKSTLESAQPGSGPGPIKNPKIGKIAILMTDGEFNTAYAGVEQGSNPTSQLAVSSGNAKALCERMHQDGIEVFTIGFMLNKDAAKETLQICASSDANGVQHYYDVNNGPALTAAFQAIAANVEKVRLFN